jgi:transposase InsO family protein
LSRPAPGHEIYPYLLRGVSIERPNQVWSTDITYIPMRGGFLYLVAVAWSLSQFWLGNTDPGIPPRPVAEYRPLVEEESGLSQNLGCYAIVIQKSSGCKS